MPIAYEWRWEKGFAINFSQIYFRYKKLELIGAKREFVLQTTNLDWNAEYFSITHILCPKTAFFRSKLACMLLLGVDQLS